MRSAPRRPGASRPRPSKSARRGALPWPRLFRATCTSQSTSTGVCKAFTLVFTNPAPSAPYVGQVLISTVTEKLPDGILAKVTAVSSSGAYTTVTGAAATPADAVTGSGSANVDLTPYVQRAAAKI